MVRSCSAVCCLLLTLGVVLAQGLAVHAALVDVDLLGGLGDFEWSYTFHWASDGPYAGSDYDWDARTDEWHRETGYIWGINYARPDDAVAMGWRRRTGSTVNPGANIVYRIVQGGGINSTNCQFFALKGIAGGGAYARLEAPRFVVNDAKPHDLHSGDRATFQIDYVRLVDHDDLPPGSSVTYKLVLSWAGGQAAKVLPKSTSPLQPSESSISCVIPSGVTELGASIIISTSGSLGARQPGAYIDGAHLYVRRAGQTTFETESVPAVRGRGVKMSKMFFSPTCDSDVYHAARDYDFLMIGEHHCHVAGRLRYYNPSIKVYFYILTNVRDGRTDPAREPIPTANAVRFVDVLADHREWLYPYTSYPYSTPDTRAPSWKRLAYRFESQYPESPTYYTRLADAGFQSAWLRGALNKVAGYRLDGVWIDTLVSAEWDSLDRKCWELQSFVHAVAPSFASAGLDLVQNGCAEHLSVVGNTDLRGLAGTVKCDPWWQPTSGQVAEGYMANSPGNTACGMQQEYAFLKPTVRDGVASDNRYDPGYWLRCLSDMDKILEWNSATGAKALSASRKRYLHMQVCGADSPTDPAGGVDGWLHFGLCSYLLAQNQWTSFGPAFYHTRALVDIDDSAVQRLGRASGPHSAYGDDPYLRYRAYEPDGAGGVGGVVVVNANPGVSRDYVLPFVAEGDSGRALAAGTVVTLKPHTGRVYIRRQPVDIEVDVPSQSAKPGDELTVTVTYRNSGVSEARDVILAVVVPDGLTYLSGSAESTGGLHDPATRTITWEVGTVPAGASGTRTFRARVN